MAEMTFSIIKKVQLEGGRRLDAEYYQPKFLELVKNLKSLGAIPIRKIATNPKRRFQPKTGEQFEYIEISEVNVYTGEYNKSNILGEAAPDRAQWVVNKNDVIVSTIRPIRNAVSIINENNKNLVCSSGFTVLKTKEIEPEYLFVYLKSRPIVRLLNRFTTATMYPAITAKDILNTKIYLGNRKYRRGIKEKVIKAHKELKKSKSLYSQAENLLLKRSGLEGLEPEDKLSYRAKLSDIKKIRRMDAEYFQPKYKKLTSIITKINWECLGKVAKRKTTKAEVKEAVNYNYVEISDINISNGEVSFSRIKGNELPANAKMQINGGELIISKVRPTRGAIGIIPDNYNKSFIASGAFSIFEIKSPIREYLQVVLRSIIGKVQMERPATGTSYPTITDEDVENILIPILPKSTLQKIAGLVRKSHASRQKAKDLLEVAKNRVEKLIENGD